MTVISVIVGSTRQGRFSEKPAQWILNTSRNAVASQRGCSISGTFQCPSSISRCRPPCRVARLTKTKWSRNGPPKSPGRMASSSSRPNTTTAPLRCSRTRSIGFIRSGTGRRLLRELWRCCGRAQRPAAPLDGDRASARSGSVVPSTFLPPPSGRSSRAVMWTRRLAQLEAPAETMIDDLLWWTGALKAAREKTLRQTA